MVVTMDPRHPTSRRLAERLNMRFRVHFQVNDGPEQVSNTLNFTRQSLAIRTGYSAKVGDLVIAQIDDLPALNGEVARVFDEGFAVKLCEQSIALIAHAQTATHGTKNEIKERPTSKSLRIISPMFKTTAPFPSWARLVTSNYTHAQSRRHYLTILTTQEIEVEQIRNVWFCVDDTRWIARVLRTGRRGAQSIIIIMINDWQLRMAATTGFCVTIKFMRIIDWTINAPAEPIAIHLNSLDQQPQSLSA